MSTLSAKFCDTAVTLFTQPDEVLRSAALTRVDSVEGSRLALPKLRNTQSLSEEKANTGILSLRYRSVQNDMVNFLPNSVMSLKVFNSLLIAFNSLLFRT